MDKKLIWKFNLIDLIIIALIVFSVAALIYKIVWNRGESVASYKFTYICEEAPAELLYGIKPDADCADGEKGTKLGKTTDISVEPIAEKPGKCRAVISTKVDGIKGKHGISVGDTVYLKGKTVSLIIDDTVFEVYLSDIT